jgi:hypothetical protein
MTAGVLAFFIALFSSLMLMVPVRTLALRVGMVDLPGPRKVHLQPIPLLGGLAMYGGVMLAILFAFDGAARAQSAGIVTGATLVAAVGFLDDRGWLHHQVKLFVAMPLAACILLASGIHAQVFSLLLNGKPGIVLDAALTIFWVVGITASFSILDHMDVRRGGGHGVDLFRDAGLFERPNPREHTGRGGTRSFDGLPSLEFQARQDFHGRRRGYVSRLPDGHARPQAAS